MVHIIKNFFFAPPKKWRSCHWNTFSDPLPTVLAWHAQKVHTTIPHWISCHISLLVTEKVGLCWAVQWRKACDPVYSFRNCIYIRAKFYIAIIWNFALFTPVTLTLNRRPSYTNSTRWRVKMYSQRNYPHQSFRHLSYYVINVKNLSVYNTV